MRKELDAKLKQEPTFGSDPVTTIWRAFEQIQQVPTEHTECTEKKPASDSSVSSVYSVGKKSGVRRFADLVSLVRFALEQGPVLEPFPGSVQQRFAGWMAQKAAAGTLFTALQRVWLEMIRDQIATSVTVDVDDFGFTPFAQRGGLGRAHQLFGDQFPALLAELNETPAARSSPRPNETRKILTTDYTDGHGFNPAFIRVDPCNPWIIRPTVWSAPWTGCIES
jgi:hypothetical protein